MVLGSGNIYPKRYSPNAEANSTHQAIPIAGKKSLSHAKQTEPYQPKSTADPKTVRFQTIQERKKILAGFFF